ncbi:complement factor H-related protein 2-like [Garra rufa]|uniref:complement factor H-related protein 2-like n=1 Tax=Garra rufa TaxID=137080 RepID=UPI003CCE97A6
MYGQRAIECLSNGKWDHSYPNCGAVTCPLNATENNIKMEQFPDFEGPVKPGYNLTFSCNGQGLILKGHREITCQSNGEWSSPFPKCEEVTCKEEQLINVDILTGHPDIVSPYKPGHILVFRCTDVNLKMHGQQIIECLSNGKWDYPFPKCGETCSLQWSTTEGLKIEGLPDIREPVKPGHKLTFSCTGEVMRLNGQREITCKSDGTWTAPFPKCTGQNSGKCGKPPRVNNSDIIAMEKKEYNTGERVEYLCFDKHTMDIHSPFSRYLTCQQGEWIGQIKCLKPCTVTEEIMDRRGIQLRWIEQQKMVIPHDNHISFSCQSGKVSVGVDLRQKCNDGDMTLPNCE